jgi:hypothetical protein
MSGTARKLVTGKRPDWLNFRRSLGRPQIPELSEYLNKYFKQSRKFETMNQYIVRKTEVYQRVKQALARVLPQQQRSTSDDYRWQRSSWRSSTWHGSWRSSSASQDRANQTGENLGQIRGPERHGQTRRLKMRVKPSKTPLRSGRPIATTPRLSPTDGPGTGPMRHQSSCQIFSKDGIF